MNEELMSTERLREKEMVRQNIQKQASLNEEFLFRRQRTFDSIRDTFFSTSTAKRFQILKDGLTNKIKNSTTGITFQRFFSVFLMRIFVHGNDFQV